MSSAWGISSSHAARGKVGSVALRVAMRWFFPVLMSRSALLRRWVDGGTYSTGICAAESRSRRSLDVSLSMTSFVNVLMPRSASRASASL